MDIRWSDIGLALTGVAALGAAAYLTLKEAGAHDAPSGWAYDAACCNMTDCQPVATESVTETRDGYLVSLAPGEHKNAPEGFSALVPYRNEDGTLNNRIRISGDSEFHVCIAPYPKPRLLCLYAKPGGV